MLARRIWTDSIREVNGAIRRRSSSRRTRGAVHCPRSSTPSSSTRGQGPRQTSDRRARAALVIRRRRGPAQAPAERPPEQAVGRFGAQMQIEIVAVGGVHPVRQPHPRVPDLDPGRAAEPVHHARQPRGGVRGHERCRPRSRPAFARIHGRISGRSWLPGTRTTGACGGRRSAMARSTGSPRAIDVSGRTCISSIVSPRSTSRSASPTASSSAASGAGRVRMSCPSRLPRCRSEMISVRTRPPRYEAAATAGRSCRPAGSGSGADERAGLERDGPSQHDHRRRRRIDRVLGLRADEHPAGDRLRAGADDEQVGARPGTDLGPQALAEGRRGPGRGLVVAGGRERRSNGSAGGRARDMPQGRWRSPSCHPRAASGRCGPAPRGRVPCGTRSRTRPGGPPSRRPRAGGPRRSRG